MRKNVASQVVGVQMISATDGSAFTGAVTVYVTGDAGTQAQGTVGSGACTHEGNGFHSYAPAQAETNYNHVAFTFVGTGAIPATVQIYTESINRHDTVRLGLTALPNAAADAAGGLPISDAGGLDLDAMRADVAAILVDTGTAGCVLTSSERNAVADACLSRNVSNVEDTMPEHCLGTIVLACLEYAVSGTTWTIKQTDGSTTHATKTLTTDGGAEHITGVA